MSINQFKFEELKMNQIERFQVKINEGMINDFRKISGDVNPLHSDQSFAISKGYKDKVVFGMLTSSFYSKLVGVYLPGKFALLNSVNIDFLKTVYVDDLLTIEGKIIEIDDRFKSIVIKSKILRSNELVSRAKIRVSMHE